LLQVLNWSPFLLLLKNQDALIVLAHMIVTCQDTCKIKYDLHVSNFEQVNVAFLVLVELKAHKEPIKHIHLAGCL